MSCYCLFQPVLNKTGVTKAVVMYCPVCGMVHVNDPLLLTRKSRPPLLEGQRGRFAKILHRYRPIFPTELLEVGRASLTPELYANLNEGKN